MGNFNRAAHLRLGRLGELAAAKLLKSKNLTLLDHNYRTVSGELDLVARDGGVLVFVEVKTLRNKGHFHDPANNLSTAQMRRNLRAARQYLCELGNPQVPCRFDLVTVRRDFRRVWEVEHYQDYYSAAALSKKMSFTYEF